MNFGQKYEKRPLHVYKFLTVVTQRYDKRYEKNKGKQISEKDTNLKSRFHTFERNEKRNEFLHGSPPDCCNYFITNLR